MAEPKKQLLVVDDNPEYRQSLMDIFTEGFDVLTATNGVEALKVLQNHQPALILLDVLMPEMDGFQTCLRIRQNPSFKYTPILFLTSKNDPSSEAFGLELGADDYILKPFDKEVLKIRVQKRLKEVSPQAAPTPPEDITLFGNCEVHWDRQESVTANGQVYSLTTKEVQLLRLLMANKGRILNRAVILEKIWSDAFITDRSIDSHIKELRRKIPSLSKQIKTVYGTGYRLD